MIILLLLEIFYRTYLQSDVWKDKSVFASVSKPDQSTFFKVLVSLLTNSAHVAPGKRLVRSTLWARRPRWQEEQGQPCKAFRGPGVWSCSAPPCGHIFPIKVAVLIPGNTQPQTPSSYCLPVSMCGGAGHLPLQTDSLHVVPVWGGTHFTRTLFFSNPHNSTLTEPGRHGPQLPGLGVASCCWASLRTFPQQATLLMSKQLHRQSPHLG